ncbi:MAG: DUF983 domain-containing protein [Bacteroidota bacterium]
MADRKSRSLFASVKDMKCPRCREGALFETSTFSLSKPFEMYDRCPKCGQNYMPEPGFYFGAMFVSYIIWGGFSVALCLTLVFGFDWSVNGAFTLLILISIVSFVWIFRISRSIWIHIIIPYRPQAREGH